MPNLYWECNENGDNKGDKCYVFERWSKRLKMVKYQTFSILQFFHKSKTMLNYLRCLNAQPSKACLEPWDGNKMECFENEDNSFHLLSIFAPS